MIVTVEQGQVLEDIAIQEYGCLEGVWNIMEDNGLNLDSQLYTGQPLIISETVPTLTNTNKEIAKQFSSKKLKPNRGIVIEQELDLYVLDGYWEEGYTE